MKKMFAVLFGAACVLLAGTHAHARNVELGHVLGTYVGLPPASDIQIGHGETEVTVSRWGFDTRIAYRDAHGREKILKNVASVSELRPMRAGEYAQLERGGFRIDIRHVGFVHEKAYDFYLITQDARRGEFALMVWHGDITKFTEAAVLFSMRQVEFGELARAKRKIGLKRGMIPRLN